MRSSLQSKLHIFDFIKLGTLLAPIVFYFVGVGPRISELKTTIDALNVSLSVTSGVAKIDQDLASVIENIEIAPSEYGMRELRELSDRANTQLQGFDGQLIDDHILHHLIIKYVESEKRRLGVQLRLGEELLTRESGTSWALKNQLRLLSESHISKTADLSEYLSLTLKYLSSEIERQRDLILSFGFLSIMIVGATMLLKNRYLQQQVVVPMQKIIRAQNELKNERFPGPIAVSPGLDAEVFEMIDSFNRMEKGLKESRNFLTVVSAATAHDLKEPLSAIISLHHIWQLKRDKKPTIEELEALWKRALLNCFSGLQLVDDILQFTRSSLNKIKIEPTDVGQIIKSAYAECLKWADPQLSFDLQMGEIREVGADQKQLAMVFRNLLMNTIKHNNAIRNLKATIEEVQQPTGKRYVTIRYLDQKASSRFLRSDEPQQQASSTSTSSGLGLVICEKIIEKMGGSFESHRNSENEFEVLIRLKAVQA
ncbi:MAG TPA: ATP-binding protein [Bdellovibrionota bacterium]|jgi:signal transduction histidine kinase|nr:ATP-binding protein [Bdellovibrionota bacterium]